MSEQLIPEECADRGSVPYWERLRQGERVNSWESQRRTKDGRILDVWVTATALQDEIGPADCHCQDRSGHYRAKGDWNARWWKSRPWSNGASARTCTTAWARS